MLLTHLFAVAIIANLSRLRFSGLLADAVLANEIGAAAIGSVAEVAFAAEAAWALLWNVRIQLEQFQVAKGSRGCREIFGPVKVAAGFVRTAKDVGEGANGKTIFAEDANSC